MRVNYSILNTKEPHENGQFGEFTINYNKYEISILVGIECNTSPTTAWFSFSINEARIVYMIKGFLNDSIPTLQLLPLIEKSIENYNHRINEIRIKDEVNEDDLRLIFSDILDLDGVSDFNWTSPRISFNRIFKPSDISTRIEFYQLLKRSISHIESMYNVKVLIGDLDSDVCYLSLKIHY